MLYTIAEREFVGLLVEKSESISSRTRYVLPVLHAMNAYWVGLLDPSTFVVLTWLINRTIVRGKAADQISITEFTSTTTDRDSGGLVSAGLPMSGNTVRRHLKLLSDAGILHIYAVKSQHRDTETRPRVFEIDCKKLVEAANPLPSDLALMQEIDAEVDVENGPPHPLQKLNPPSHRLKGASQIYREISSGLDKSNLYPPRSAAAGSAGENLTPEVEETNVKPLPTPKYPRRAVVRRDESAVESIARIKSAHRVNEGGRADAAAGGALTTQNLQALIDKTMRERLPELPRVVVTQKPFGVFRKRIESANVDIAKFVDFALSQWSLLASQNRAAMLKNPDKARRSTPLPSAPNFTTFAYKLPYFIAAYANNVTSTAEGRQRAADTGEAAQLRAKLAATERELELTKEVMRSRAKPLIQRSRPVAPAQVQRTAATDADLSDTWSPPEWSGGAEPKQRRAVRGK